MNVKMVTRVICFLKHSDISLPESIDETKMVTGTRVLLYPKFSIEYQKVLRVEIITPSTQLSFEL